MIERTEAITSGMLKLALDATSLNHQAIANNIANVGSHGYRPARVNFEQQLGSIQQTLAQGGRVKASMLDGILPVLELLPGTVDGDRTASLDMETARLAENTVHYEALLKATGMRMSMLNAAINEGKR
jgi:flagellar basal-body rod protein FlgB